MHYSATSAVCSTNFLWRAGLSSCWVDLGRLEGWKRTGLKKAVQKKRRKPNTTQLERSWDYKVFLGGYVSGRDLHHHLGDVHIQCVVSFLTVKMNTKPVHESKQLWSIWIWGFSLDLFFIHSLHCSWNKWTDSDRLEFGLASVAFDPFNSCLSNLHRQMPPLPPKTPHMQGLYQSAIPLEHLSRTSLRKCVSRQDAQLSHYPSKDPFRTLTQIWHEPTHKNVTALTTALPIRKQCRWIALLIFSWCLSLQQSSNFSPSFLDSLQFTQSFCSCRCLLFLFTT